MLECSCHIISYLADVMNALRQSSGQGTSALLVEGEEKAMEVDSDWVEELAVEDDDSQAEDSVRNNFFTGVCVCPLILVGFCINVFFVVITQFYHVVVDQDEDSLCNKLCTFIITQKEFMNQHW